MIMPQKGGRRKVQTPRIDLTPMVDLGFLLITFFMFTTTLAQNKALELNMPNNEPTRAITAFPEESTLTVIPVKNHIFCYYSGLLQDNAPMQATSISKMRGLLQAKKNEVANLPKSFSKNAHLLHVLIKPNSDCTYGDVVNLMDELLINPKPRRF